MSRRTWHPTADDAALARDVSAVLGPCACFERDGVVWAAAAEGAPLGSAVLAVILGIRATAPDADLVLRRRILRVGTSHPVDRAVVQVVGRRFGDVVPAEGDAQTVEIRDVSDAAARMVAYARDALVVAPDGCATEAEALAAAAAHAVPDDADARYRDRPVGAVLFDGTGRALAMARSLGGRNRALHAEVALAVGWLASGRAWPDDAEVVVTLSPCRMCASVLDHLGVRRVVAGARDPGRLAKDTPVDDRLVVLG